MNWNRPDMWETGGPLPAAISVETDTERAARKEQTEPTRRTERIWTWYCESDNRNCTRGAKPVEIPPNKVPDPCYSCGSETFRKDGEKLRPVPVRGLK
jgi:hypothetical protein